MENKLPTTEEFLNSEEFYSVNNDFDTHQAMIAFAKMHVKAALEAAANSMSFGYEANRGKTDYSVYPESLIK